MRVCAVVPLYPPKSLVGSWLATHELLRGLAARGDQVDVYRRLSGANTYELDGVNVHAGRSVDELAEAIGASDIVVSHLGDDGMASYLAHEHRKPNVRLAHGSHDDAAERLEGATLAVFNSRALADEAGWSGPQTVVHPPIRPGHLARPGDRVTLVNLSDAKGAELFWRLAKRRPKRRFLAVRGGWGLQIIFRRPNVFVMRSTPRMSIVYARTRVLLMPSEKESWGMTGVEAMACGIPVIAHPTPGLCESLGAAGIFADRADEHAWLEQLDRLADPVQWQRDSERSLARAAELAGEDSVGQFAAALDRLVEGGPHGISKASGRPGQVRRAGEGRQGRGREERQEHGLEGREEEVAAT